MTNFVTEIEQELIDATNFKPERSYRDRQMYLGALLKACIHDLDDDQFDALSDAAAEWCNAAAEANRDGHPLPDFIEEGDHGSNGTEQAEIVGEATTSFTGSESIVEPTEPEVERSLPKEKAKKAKTKGKGGRPKKIKVASEKPKKKKEIKTTGIQEYIALAKANGLNQWGVTNGTKADLACKMAAQEGGTTMRAIREATGGNKYNLFNRLKRYNHDVRFENDRIYLGKPVTLPPEATDTAAE